MRILPRPPGCMPAYCKLDVQARFILCKGSLNFQHRNILEVGANQVADIEQFSTERQERSRSNAGFMVISGVLICQGFVPFFFGIS